MNTSQITRFDKITIIATLLFFVEVIVINITSSATPYFLVYNGLLSLLYCYVVYKSLKHKEYVKAFAALCFIIAIGFFSDSAYKLYLTTI